MIAANEENPRPAARKPLRSTRRSRPVTVEERLVARALKARDESDVRRRIWQCIRVLRSFSAGEIAMTSDLPIVSVRRYLLALAESGYLRVVPARDKREGSVSVYVLAVNPGPHAPRPMGARHVWDANRRELYWRTKGGASAVPQVAVGRAA